MFFSSSELSPAENYRLLVNGVIPRPIAWISSLSAEGVLNLAPYSFFTVASCTPPVLLYTQVNPRDRQAKDTLNNLQATGECVVNLVSADLFEAMNASCADYPAHVSEPEAIGLVMCASQHVRVAGVAAAKMRFECRLREVIQIASTPGAGSMALLDVLGVYVADAHWQASGVLQPALDAMGKLAGDDYCLTRDTRQLARPLLKK